MARFVGWPKAAFKWFEGLQADNSRDYFTANRATYDAAVKGPLVALLADLEPEFGPGKIFRPNRDVRFSADKSPYKTNAAAVAPGDMREPGFWVEVSAEGMAAGAGHHGGDSARVECYRKAVDREESGAALEQIVAQLEGAGLEIFGETLKSAPRGYPRDHPRIRLLRHRDIIAVRHLPVGDVVDSPATVTWVRDTWRLCSPLVAWLREHL